MSTLVIIPARLGAARLPRKPLALLHGKPLIHHVIEQAHKANIGPVVVAVDSNELKACVEQAGGHAILTDPHLPSGSDRIYQALETFDPQETFTRIVNIQGDMAVFPAHRIKDLVDTNHFDITTAVIPLDKERQNNPHNVKAVITPSAVPGWHQAHYFSRAPVPYGAATMWHHMGVYVFHRPILKRFVSLPPSPLEQTEKLEQLRALSQGWRIGVKTLPKEPWLSIDTPQDIHNAETFLRQNASPPPHTASKTVG